MVKSNVLLLELGCIGLALLDGEVLVLLLHLLADAADVGLKVTDNVLLAQILLGRNLAVLCIERLVLLVILTSYQLELLFDAERLVATQLHLLCLVMSQQLVLLRGQRHLNHFAVKWHNLVHEEMVESFSPLLERNLRELSTSLANRLHPVLEFPKRFD